MRGQTVQSLDGGVGEVANGVATGGYISRQGASDIDPLKSTDRHDAPAYAPIT